MKEGKRGVNGRKEDKRKEIESIVYEGELFASFLLFILYLPSLFYFLRASTSWQSTFSRDFYLPFSISKES